MSRQKALILSVAALVLGALGWASLFTVEPWYSVIVLQFGEPKEVCKEPGLYTKIPFMQKLVVYDKRAMCFEAPTEQVITSDKKRLLVDAYIVYKIVDPVAYYKRLRNQESAHQRMHALTVSALRGFLGRVTFEGFLKERRRHVLEEIQASLTESTKDFGIMIEDVRVSRAELPPQNSQAIYRRMISERTRIAKQVRAEGQEKATKMKASAQKEAAQIVTNARRRSVEIESDSKAYACRKHAQMARKDKQLFRVYKGADFVKRNLNGEQNNWIVSSKDSAVLMPLRDAVSS